MAAPGSVMAAAVGFDGGVGGLGKGRKRRFIFIILLLLLVLFNVVKI